VSINTAIPQQLFQVKDISARMATLIIAGRPYASVEELLKIRGIGNRSLMRLLSFLGL